MSAIRDFLQQRLADGEWCLGQVLIRADLTMCHIADADAANLEIFTRPEDARELAKYAAAGNYRPLKTAPNLKQGWLLKLSSHDEVRLALDFIYPAALGMRVAFERSELSAIPLRDTLNRQTGMYRVTQLITDEQAAEVIRKTCDEGCLRRRLWSVNSAIQNPKSKIQNFEVLCAEACNLQVAACRPVAKRNLPSPAETGEAPAGL